MYRFGSRFFGVLSALLVLAASSTDAQVRFESVDVVQPEPNTIDEGYEAGWELMIDASFSVSPGTGGQLWLHLFAPEILAENRRATFGDPGSSCPGADIIINDAAWREDAPSSDLDGGPVPGTFFYYPVDMDSDNQPDRMYTLRFRIGQVCDDDEVELPEGFTARVFACSVSSATRPNSTCTEPDTAVYGAGISQSVLINDDDSLGPVVDLELFDRQGEIGISWRPPVNRPNCTAGAGCLGYDVRYRDQAVGRWHNVGIDVTESPGFSEATPYYLLSDSQVIKPGGMYDVEVRAYYDLTPASPGTNRSYGPWVDASIELAGDDGPGVPPGLLNGIVFSGEGIGINGRDPALLNEADAEQILDVSLAYRLPDSHPGGAHLWIRVFPSGRNYAEFGAAAPDRLRCGEGDHGDPKDILVGRSSWLETEGGSTGYTTPDITGFVGGDESALFRFGLLCHDEHPEATESFTLEAWFSSSADNPQAAKTSAVARIGRITDDDDGPGAIVPPTDLTVTKGGAGTLSLSWTAADPPPFQYTVWYRLQKLEGDPRVDPPWTRGPTVPGTSSSPITATLSGLEDGSPYAVIVCSQREDGTPPIELGNTPGPHCLVGQGTPGEIAQPPEVGTQLPDITIGVGQEAEVLLDGAFVDPDPDDPGSFTYQVSSANSAVATALPAAPMTKFTVRGVSAGSSLITVIATDKGPSGSRGGGSARQSFTVTVVPEPVNQPPIPCTGGGDDDESSTCIPLEDLTLSLRENVNVSLVGAFTDPEGDSLTYSVESSQTTTVTVTQPAGNTFRVVAVAVGTATITVTATDGMGQAGRPAAVAFTVTVIPPPANQPPEAGPADLPDRDLALGAEAVVNLAGVFMDPENDPLTYVPIAEMPDVILVGAMSPGDTTFEIRGQGVGSSLISVTADDGQDGPGRPARRDFTVTVALAEPPLVGGLNLSLEEDDSAVTATWTALDSLWEPSYELEARPGMGLEGVEPRIVEGVLEPPVVFSGLRPGTWAVRIRAVNRVGAGPWSEPREVVVPEPGKVTIRFAAGELVSQDPRRCPAPTHIGERAGYITLELDRPVDFEVRVEVVPVEGPAGFIQILQSETSTFQGLAAFMPGVDSVKLRTRAECRVAAGDGYVFELMDPTAVGRDNAGRAIIAPGGGRFTLTVDAMPVVPALPFFGTAVLAIALFARFIRSVRVSR